MLSTGARSFVWYSRGVVQTGKTMGGSSSHPFIASESLESRRFLSAAPIQAAPLPLPTSIIFVAPAVHFSGVALIANSIGTIQWDRGARGFSDGDASVRSSAMATVTFSVISSTNSDGSAGTIDPAAGPYQSGSDGSTESDREAYLASLAAAGGADGANSSIPPGTNPPPVMGNVNVPGPTRGQGNGNGKGVTPGVLHPGESGGPGTNPTGSDGSPGDGSSGSDGQGSGGSQHAHPAEGHVLSSTVVESAGAGSSAADGETPSHKFAGVTIAAVSDKPTSGLAQAAYSSVEMVVRPLTTSTFSILPLAVAELSAPGIPVDSAPPAPSLPEQFARVIERSPGAAAVLRVVNSIITDEAAPARASLVNLFHVDALATFGDSMGAFIDESAAPAVTREPSPHSRALKITAAVVAADALLIGYWVATRRRDEAADATQSKAGLFPFFDGRALAPR